MHWASLFSTPCLDLFYVVQRLRRRRARRHRAWRASFSALALLGSVAVARATSVTPPSFTELVGEAQVIARATVSGVESRWVEKPNGRVIKTFVTFKVDQRLKGETPDEVTLEFLGGTVGGDTLKVGGMPEFQIGQHEIVFVQGNGVQFCPLVRFGHGRYHVRTDAQTRRDYVARNDETPLTSVADVQTPADDHGARAFRSSGPAMTPGDFETAIRNEVARERSQP